MKGGSMVVSVELLEPRDAADYHPARDKTARVPWSGQHQGKGLILQPSTPLRLRLVHSLRLSLTRYGTSNRT